MVTEALTKLKRHATRKVASLMDKYDNVKYALETTSDGEPILLISYNDRLDCLRYNEETKVIDKAGIAYYSFQKDRTKDKNKFMYIGYIRSYDERQGLGGLMMQYLERLAKDNDCKFIDLIAATGTEGFYKKFGYSRNLNKKTMHHYAKDLDAFESDIQFKKDANPENY